MKRYIMSIAAGLLPLAIAWSYGGDVFSRGPALGTSMIFGVYLGYSVFVLFPVEEKGEGECG